MRSRAKRSAASASAETRCFGGVELGRRDAEPLGRQRQPVEARGVVDERRVAAPPDVVDDRRGPPPRRPRRPRAWPRAAPRNAPRNRDRTGGASSPPRLAPSPRPAQAVSSVGGKVVARPRGRRPGRRRDRRAAPRCTRRSIRSIAAAGKEERDVAGRRIGRLEADGEQLEHRVGPVAPEVAALRRGDPVEDQGAPPALVDLVVVAVHSPRRSGSWRWRSASPWGGR